MLRYRPPLPPYGLEPTAFRFPGLAALAGRAQMGGPLEVALATYLVARLAQDAGAARPLGPGVRSERATAMRGWLSSVALPAGVRNALAKCVDATTGPAVGLVSEIRNVITVTAPNLDSDARLELDRLAAEIEAQALVK